MKSFLIDFSIFYNIQTKMWKDIKWIVWYEINESGQVRNKKTWLIRKTFKGSDWYRTIDIWWSRYKVHRLVAKTFIPNPHKHKEVNHIDGDKMNANIENLEWVTPSQNVLHSWKIWLHKYKNEDKRKWVVWYDIYWNKVYEFTSLTEAARTLWLSRWNIWNVCRWIGKTYWWIVRKFL